MSQLIATPDKSLVVPGLGAVGLASVVANGKSAVLVRIPGQGDRLIELGYEQSVQLAYGILASAIQAKELQKAASNGSILATDGSREVAG